MLTFEQIKELVELVAQRRLQGVEIERSGFRLKIEGQSAAPAAAPAPTAAAPAAQPPAPAVSAAPLLGAETSPSGGVPEAQSPGASAAAAGAHVLTSPIVGTFYRSPSPDTDPFVQVGDRVRKGQVLCIIEAMKLMNEIESDADGVIVEIYPQNAQPVEFGEPLFAIRA